MKNNKEKPEIEETEIKVEKPLKEIRYEVLRIWTDALYDHQEVRMASSNRVRSLIRRKLLSIGFAPEKKKVDTDSDKEPSWSDEELLSKIQEAVDKNLLSDADRSFLATSFELAKKEEEEEHLYEKRLLPLLKTEPISEWLDHVKGIGPRNKVRLIKYFGYCEDYPNVAKIWAHAGLSVIIDETGVGHAPKRVKGQTCKYDSKLKSQMLGVLGTSLKMAGGKYKTLIYEPYKRRIFGYYQDGAPNAEGIVTKENRLFFPGRGCCTRPHPKHKGKMCKDYPGHADRMAVRYMVKIFLSHYFEKCRQIRGLPVREPYPIEYLKHETRIDPLVDD